jgi:hypothetical protein
MKVSVSRLVQVQDAVQIILHSPPMPSKIPTEIWQGRRYFTLNLLRRLSNTTHGSQRRTNHQLSHPTEISCFSFPGLVPVPGTLFWGEDP